MDIELQVCTYEQAKKLKYLGVGIESGSYFRWVSFRNESSPKEFWNTVHKSVLLEHEAEEYYDRDYLKDLEDFPAFTVAELGIMLPDLLETNLQYELVFIKEADDEWLCRYVRNNNLIDWHPTAPARAGKTEAEVRAEILISLLEEKLISADEINGKLCE